MAILNMKEFATLVGLSYDTVKKNAQRGNIVKGTGGKIDTENATNRLFIDEKKASNSVNPTKYKNDIDEKPTNKRKVSSEQPTGLTTIQKEYADIELRKKRADLDLVERGAELKRIQLEKAAGNLLPVDLVSAIFSINIQSIFKSIEGNLENIASVYVERFGGTRKDLAEIVEVQRVELSKAIEQAKENGFIELENAISEFRETRGRGEKY